MTPTRILVLGGGGREHALAWKLAGEPGVTEVVVAPGGAAMVADPRVITRPVDPLDPGAVVALARAEAAELVVVGPEAPLEAGVGDALRAAGIPVFGPDAAAARIETSKAHCREVAAAAGVRMAKGAAFDGETEAIAFARRLATDGDGVVVKADGLAAGKGVTVCDSLPQAETAIRALFAQEPGTQPAAGMPASPRVVIEERLTGPEASLIAICDGRDALALPFARDHKRLLDGDAGPNTGGMGAYSPLPDLPDEAADELVATIHRPVLAELRRRGTPFIGALYAGLILTADGPALLEFNARFGDPEAQVLLPRLAVPLGPLLLAAAHGRLRQAAGPPGPHGDRLPPHGEATVGIVLAAAGYPDAPRRGDPISGLDQAAARALVFHAGTSADPAGGFLTAGGRVLAVVGHGRSLAEARAAAEAAADAVAFRGLQRRRDIAADPPGGRAARIAIEPSGGDAVGAATRPTRVGVRAGTPWDGAT